MSNAFRPDCWACLHSIVDSDPAQNQQIPVYREQFILRPWPVAVFGSSLRCGSTAQAPSFTTKRGRDVVRLK